MKITIEGNSQIQMVVLAEKLKEIVMQENRSCRVFEIDLDVLRPNVFYRRLKDKRFDVNIVLRTNGRA